MDSKHLTKGDPEPPLAPGTLRLYSMKWCPYAQRTRLVLRNKLIEHEEINFNTKVKPEWIFSKNPLGTAPTLEKDGKTLWESAICSDYLDEMYPDLSPLYPDDPFEKAKLRVKMDALSKIIPHIYGCYKESDEEKKASFEKLQQSIGEIDKALEGQIMYFGGSVPCMLDFHLWPFIERLPILKIMRNLEPMPPGQFPRVEAWIDAMMKVPEVKEVYITPQQHAEFLKGYLAGSPVFDF